MTVTVTVLADGGKELAGRRYDMVYFTSINGVVKNSSSLNRSFYDATKSWYAALSHPTAMRPQAN
jgi:hypothetical protein